MFAAHTVTARSTTTTADELGNSTEANVDTAVPGVLFAPEGYVENAGTSSPTVIGDATLYGQIPALDADDTVLHEAGCCDGSDFALGTWQVVGGSRGWGGGNRVLPIRKAS